MYYKLIGKIEMYKTKLNGENIKYYDNIIKILYNELFDLETIIDVKQLVKIINEQHIPQNKIDIVSLRTVKLFYIYYKLLNENINKLCMMLSFVYDIYNIKYIENKKQYYDNMSNKNSAFINFEILMSDEDVKELYNIFKNDVLQEEDIAEELKNDLKSLIEKL